MTSKDYLLKALNEIHSKIKNVTIRYQFEAYKSMHIIEVLPLDLFKENDEYINWEISIDKYFEENYPNEDLLFISSDSLSKIDNPEIILLPTLSIKTKVASPICTKYSNIVQCPDVITATIGDKVQMNNNFDSVQLAA